MPRTPIALPSGHFMGLAPLDAWARLLVACRFRVHPRYWLRLACAVGTSLLATAVTLPERLLLWPFLALRFGGPAPRLTPRRDAVVILGYFRSGTTHLHNLLATHPDTVTPKWVQAMSPQGFWLSWSLLRWALVPFLPNTRPQDEVAFGPDWPAEDDFAHNNWALASSLPGRLVLVRERERWARFNALDRLSERDLARWRRAAAAFAWKVCAARPRRSLLLKTPSHTARVGELDRLFAGRVRFVHITRSAEDVVRSNVAMHARLEGQSLQELPDAEETREAIVREYVDTEHRFLADAARLQLETGRRLVRLRYDDLVAAPMAELERTCRTLGLCWDDGVRRRAAIYLAEVGEHRVRKHPSAQEQPDPRLAELEQALGAGLPATPPAPEPPPQERATRTRRLRGVLVAWSSAAACLALWLWLAHLTHRRLDLLTWPLGIVIGAAALRGSGRGDWRLGLWAALAMAAMVAASIWPLPEIANGWTGRDRYLAMGDAYGSFNNNYVYLLFGMLSAYRYASRRFLKPPGM